MFALGDVNNADADADADVDCARMCIPGVNAAAAPKGTDMILAMSRLLPDSSLCAPDFLVVAEGGPQSIRNALTTSGDFTCCLPIIDRKYYHSKRSSYLSLIPYSKLLLDMLKILCTFTSQVESVVGIGWIHVGLWLNIRSRPPLL